MNLYLCILQVKYSLLFVYFTGKRAVFVPPSSNEPVDDSDTGSKGVLYCVSVDSRGNSHNNIKFISPPFLRS